MISSIIVTPAAELDIAQAIEWYNAIGPSLSLYFRLALERSFERIAERPDAYVPLSRDIRRALLHRFSYAIYYRKLPMAIQIIAVLHTSRNPRIWQSRNH